MSKREKKTDSSKKRISKSKSRTVWIERIQRKSGIETLSKKRFLIVCEDEKSAPNYFRGLVKHHNLYVPSFKIIGSDGKPQPIIVVKKAISMKENAADPNSKSVPFDEVWCVIDGDYGNAIANARFKAEANDVKLAISTMCFEYWILLHFEESAAPTIDCDGLVSALKEKHISNYTKGDEDFRTIVPHVHEACQRAEKLRKPGVKRGEKPEDQNPCSEVYLLINAILKTDSKAAS